MPVRHPYEGFVGCLKTDGSAAGDVISTGTQRNILCTRAVPVNNLGNAYPGVINAVTFASVRVKGKRRPAASLSTCYKPYNSGEGWCDRFLFNSLINIAPNRGNTDRFCLNFVDIDYNTGSKVAIDYLWDWSRCYRIRMSQVGTGGPLMMQLDFLSRFADIDFYGATLPDGEVLGSAPVFSFPDPDAGELVSVADVVFSGFTNVTTWTLDFIRGQGYEDYIDGTLYPKDVASTMFTGSLVITQSVAEAVFVADKGPASIFIGPGGAGTGSLQMDLTCVLDDPVYPRDVGFGLQTLSYSLVDLVGGGNPIYLNPAYA